MGKSIQMECSQAIVSPGRTWEKWWLLSCYYRKYVYSSVPTSGHNVLFSPFTYLVCTEYWATQKSAEHFFFHFAFKFKAVFCFVLFFADTLKLQVKNSVCINTCKNIDCVYIKKKKTCIDVHPSKLHVNLWANPAKSNVLSL